MPYLIDRALPELVETLLIYSKLLQDSVKKWWADFLSAMNRDGSGTPIWVLPSFVASGLAGL
jgi:hypothetical protein